nr:hypothetical protein [Tanacetum cinerariifolium]
MKTPRCLIVAPSPFSNHTLSLSFLGLNDVPTFRGSLSTLVVQSVNIFPVVKLTPGYISSGLVQNSVYPTPYVPPSKKDYDFLFQPLFDKYFNPPPCAVSLIPAVVAAPRVVDPAGLTSSTSIDQDVPYATCKKALNLLKKGLLIRGEAVEASKRRRGLLDHKIQLLSKGLSEGSGIILEVPDEPKDNSCCSSNLLS